MADRVRYLDPEPSGMALMLGGLIEANLAAHPEREGLTRRRAVYTIVASDARMAVSIRLGGGRVLVRDAEVSRPDIRVEGDSETLISMSGVPRRFGLPDPAKPRGRAVLRKLLARDLRVRGLIRHPTKLARLTGLLSVVEGGG